MSYAEPLPENCPPFEAQDTEHQTLYRLLRKGEADPEEFASHKARGRANRTKVDPCSFASCSLLADYQKYLDDIPGLRKAHTHVAKLQIPNGYGKSKAKKTKGNVHVDFWCFQGKSLQECVVEIVPLPKGNV